MELSKLTWPKIEELLNEGHKTLIIPVGSTEQHGPTGLIGTDFLTAQAISLKVGEELGCLVAPCLNYGMANHHLGFPGSAALNPSTYIQVQVDLLGGWITQGFQNFVYINGHGGNIAPLNCAISELKRQNDCSKIGIFNWWHLDSVRSYEEKVFGDENGSHATCGEISLTQWTEPEAFESITPQNFEVSSTKTHWPISPLEMRKVFPDGRCGSNPGLANSTHGETLFKLAVSEICEKMKQREYI